MVLFPSVQRLYDLTLFIVESPRSHEGLAKGYTDVKWITFITQWFQNKPATAGVPPATWLYVAGYSGHNSLLVTNNLCVASYYNFTLNFAAIIHTQKDVSVVSCSKKLKSSAISCAVSCAVRICVLSLSRQANLLVVSVGHLSKLFACNWHVAWN